MANPAAHPPKQFLALWQAHTGPLPQGPFASDGKLIEALVLQEEGLLDFATQHSVSLTQLEDLRKRRAAGGQEHEVYLPKILRDRERVWKVTKPGRWGLTRATPSEYLARLERLDANSETYILVEGIAVENGLPLLVTSMDYVDGTHPEGAMLHALLLARGWEQAYDGLQLQSYQLRGDGTRMRDAHRKNFILTRQDRLVPIDVIFEGFARFDLRLDTPAEEEEDWEEAEEILPEDAEE